MSKPITNTEDAVRELGALPAPVGPEPQSGAYARRRAALGVVHGAWKRQAPTAVTAVTALDHAGLLLSPEVAAELEGLRLQVEALLAERHSTNESLDTAIQSLREKEKREAVVAEFVAARAEYITALRNCHGDNTHDYDRWQGHAAARRQLSELLGLPVAWPPEDPSVTVSAEKLAALLAPSEGGTQ